MAVDNSDFNSDVWFTVTQLAEMGLPGYPRTARRWHDRAKADGWRSREVASQGRTGYRTEYTPPPAVMALIEARQRGDLPERPMLKACAKPVSRQRDLHVKTPLGVSDKLTLYSLEPSGEWLMLATFAISDASWLPDAIKKDRQAQIRLALNLYNLLCTHLGSDDAKWQWMMDSEDALQHALHFAYDLEQIDMKTNPD